MLLKRIFDIVCSLIGIVVLSPIFIIVSLLVMTTSKGGVIFKQKRVGRYGKDFFIYKFRTMYVGSDKGSQITVGGKDSRITKVGHYLRKFKIDELPQLFNVLIGDMSLVGPRPEVRYYVDMYTEGQKEVLNYRGGITDPASIKYRNENELLGLSDNPQEYYIKVVMPDKIRINLKYQKKRSLFTDISIIFKTIFG